MRTVRIILLLAVVLTLSACRSSRDAVDEARRVARDTVRVVSLARDTVMVRDTVREAVRERGDTVWVTRETVRWRERTSRRVDTLWRERTDTLLRTRTETVLRGRPRSLGDWAWPMATGALAGVAAVLWLMKKKG